MNDAMAAVNRRALFAAGGALAFAAACVSVASEADAAQSGADEKSNSELVRNFCKAWGDDPPDADKIAGEYLAEDCVVRFGETIPPVTGPADAAELFKSFLTNDQRYDLKIIDLFARGPVVMTARIDSTIKGKKITKPTSVVGVFVVRDGKIKEWSDYV